MASAPNAPPGSSAAPPAPALPPSRLSPRGWGWPDSDPYWYPLNSPTIATGQSGQAQLQLDTDADFLWDRINASGYTNGFAQWSVYLQDASRGVPLIGSPLAPLDQVNVGGDGQTFVSAPASFFLGFWLPKPYRLRRGTILAATFFNLATVSPSPLAVQLVLTGRKVAPR